MCCCFIKYHHFNLDKLDVSGWANSDEIISFIFACFRTCHNLIPLLRHHVQLNVLVTIVKGLCDSAFHILSIWNTYSTLSPRNERKSCIFLDLVCVCSLKCCPGTCRLLRKITFWFAPPSLIMWSVTFEQRLQARGNYQSRSHQLECGKLKYRESWIVI